MSRDRRSFWITNHFANHVVRPLLRGPLASRIGRQLALLRVPGRRTGRIYELPVQYVRDHNTIWIVPAHPERKTWWRNLRGSGREIELRLANHEYRGHAVALEGETAPEAVAAGLGIYLDAMPRAARALGINSSTGSERQAQLERMCPDVRIVRVDLTNSDTAPKRER